MAKNLALSVLLDFYGEMLTDKQRDAVELYYNEDLSLAEIAEHMHITRQGVRDSIKRAEHQLLEWESRLGLVGRFHEIQSGLDQIVLCAEEIHTEHAGSPYYPRIGSKLQQIIQTAKTINN